MNPTVSLDVQSGLDNVYELGGFDLVLDYSHPPTRPLPEDQAAWVAERLTGYKQPREVRFVGTIPRTASGKILRRELRELL